MRLSVKSVFGVTYFAYALLYATRKPFSVVKPLVQDELGLTADALGLIDTGFLAAYAVGQVTLPISLAYYNVKPSTALFFLYLGSGLVSVAFGLTHQPSSLLLLWVVNGVLHAAVFPLLVQCLSPWILSSSRGFFMGCWTTSQQVGATVATIVASLMASMVGWRAVFIWPGAVTAVFSLVLSALLSEVSAQAPDLHTSPVPRNFASDGGAEVRDTVGLRESEMSRTLRRESCDHSASTSARLIASEPRSLESALSTSSHPDDTEQLHIFTEHGEQKSLAPSAHSASAAEANTVVITRSSVATLVRLRDLQLISLAYFGVKCVRYSLLFWLPYYLVTELFYATSAAGYCSILFDIGGIAGGIAAGQISDRLFRGRRLLIAMTSCLVSSFALPIFATVAYKSKLLALIWMAIIGFSVAGADSIIGGSAAADICDRYGLPASALATVTGVINGSGSVGAVLQAYLTAYISSRLGWAALYSSLAVTCLFSALVLIVPVLNENSSIVAKAPRVAFPHERKAGRGGITPVACQV